MSDVSHGWWWFLCWFQPVPPDNSLSAAKPSETQSRMSPLCYCDNCWKFLVIFLFRKIWFLSVIVNMIPTVLILIILMILCRWTLMSHLSIFFLLLFWRITLRGLWYRVCHGLVSHSCFPTNSVKALKIFVNFLSYKLYVWWSHYRPVMWRNT